MIMKFKLLERQKVSNIKSNIPSPAIRSPLGSGEQLYVNYIWYTSDNSENCSGKVRYVFQRKPGSNNWSIISQQDSVFADAKGATNRFYINVYADPNADIYAGTHLSIFLFFDSYKDNSGILITSGYFPNGGRFQDDNRDLSILCKSPIPAFTPTTGTNDAETVQTMVSYLINWISKEHPEAINDLFSRESGEK